MATLRHLRKITVPSLVLRYYRRYFFCFTCFLYHRLRDLDDTFCYKEYRVVREGNGIFLKIMAQTTSTKWALLFCALSFFHSVCFSHHKYFRIFMDLHYTYVLLHYSRIVPPLNGLKFLMILFEYVSIYLLIFFKKSFEHHIVS